MMMAKSITSKIHQLFAKIKTDPYLLARQNLYLNAQLFTRDVEPKYNYADKCFTLLSLDFDAFLRQADIRTFLLQASPRTGKTEFIINIVLGYILGMESKRNVLLVAGNQKLKKDLRRKLQRVIKTQYYIKTFGGVYITSANDNEILLSNGNQVDFMTTGSDAPTGKGYHYIFLIDFLLPEILRSPAQLETALSQYNSILSRTQDNPATKLIIDNQRLGVNDLSALVIGRAKEHGEPYHSITLPYYFEENTKIELFNKSRSIEFKECEYLVSRFNEREKRAIMAKLGLETFECQYQQKPRPPGGEVFEVKHFMYYKPLDLQQKFIDIFITTDFAFEAKKYNDWSVLCCWGITDTDHLYLLDMVRVKEKGIVVERLLNLFINKWMNGFNNGGSGLTRVLSENVASMKIINQDFKAKFGSLWLELTRTKDKYSRACEMFGFFESGKVWLPSVNVQIDGVRDVKNDIVDPLLNECSNFRREATEYAHDDIVDCFIDACVYAMKNNSAARYDFTTTFSRI